MKYEMKNPFFAFPPGSKEDSLSDICGNNGKSISRAVFTEHRFSFCWWNRWTQEKRKGNANYLADIITMDFHNDLHFPDKKDYDELKDLNLSNDFDVSFYSWARLNVNSDDHILSACYLNIIGNVYALTKQFIDEREFTCKDIEDKEHKIFVFDDYQKLLDKLNKVESNNYFLDIDLDYFVITEGNYGSHEGWKLADDKIIEDSISKENGIIGNISEKLDAITIALEPDYTGGLKNSFNVFSTIENTLFDESGMWK